MEVGDSAMTGRIVLSGDPDKDGRSLKSKIMSEAMRLRHKEKYESDVAYWVACEAVGGMVDPPLTAEEANKLASDYTVRAGRKTKEKRAQAARPKEGGGLGDGWFEVEEPVVNKMQELEEYIGTLRLGQSRMKRSLTKDEAKSWQTAVSAWARKPRHRKDWYDPDGTPRFSTNVASMGGSEYAIIINKLR